MGAEDFAFFTEEGPGLFIRLGLGVDSPPLHAPEFAFNDEALPTGMLALAGMAVRICAPEAEAR
jgi:metal-dependent amidase/aminoacylase/carboxypeptidase family protein